MYCDGWPTQASFAWVGVVAIAEGDRRCDEGCTGHDPQTLPLARRPIRLNFHHPLFARR